MALRTRNAAVISKIQSVAGTFDAPNTTTDGLLVERPTFRPTTKNTQTNEVTGSLDPRAPIIGGMQIQIDFSFYVKGSGTPGVAPEWGDIAKACGLDEVITLNTISGSTFALTNATTLTDSANGLAGLTVGSYLHLTTQNGQVGEAVVTASAAGSLTISRLDSGAAFVAETAAATWTIRYGVAAVAATAGSATGFTAQAPWAATLNLYRGMPVLLSTNPAVPEFVVASAYSAARVAAITKTMSPALDNTTKVSIPPNVRYQPKSTSLPSVSMAWYLDGLLWRFRDCVGTMRFEIQSGGAIKAMVTMQGCFESKTDAAVVTPSYDGTRPGIWRNSRFAFDRVTCGLSNMTIDLANQVEFPDNPNNAEGYDPPQITARQVQVTADPYMTVVATRDLFSKLRASTSVMVDAQVKGNAGANPGQRLGVTIPTVVITRDDPAENGGFSTEAFEGFCDGQDSGFMLAAW
jgi:hypothetical protein